MPQPCCPVCGHVLRSTELPSGMHACPVAGKTTLLQVLAGKYMVGQDVVRILGRPAFHDISLVSWTGEHFETWVGQACILVAACSLSTLATDGTTGSRQLRYCRLCMAAYPCLCLHSMPHSFGPSCRCRAGS